MKIYIKLFAILCVTVAATTYGQVGIGTDNPDKASLLELNSTNQGFLPPRMTEVQRNNIPAPAEGLVVYNTDTDCPEFFDGTCWVCYKDMPKDGTAANKAALSCKAIKDKKPASPDGVYWLDIDACAATYSAVQAYCDMTTDGGGWTLVLNYNHAANTNPNLNVRTVNFPLLGSTVPGTNEANTVYWGHTNNAMLNKMSFTEIMFYGKGDYTGSSNPTGGLTVHFKTSLPAAVSYIKTGTGNMSGLRDNRTLLPKHVVNGNIPNGIDRYWGDRGDYAMTNWPFWDYGTAGWAIKGTDTVYSSWVMGSFATGHTDPYSTYHQIWVR